jgi:hypothetical protein
MQQLPVGQDSEHGSRQRGIGQYYPTAQEYCYYCASHPECPSTGGNAALAMPATLTHFNNHPTGLCRRSHPHWIREIAGCAIHRGVLDQQGHCHYCSQELLTGALVQPQDIRTTVGFPGEEAM